MREPLPSGADIAAALERHLGDARLPAVASVYLFGSQASGKAHRESDVDVGVLLRWDAHPTRAARFEAGLALVAELQVALGRLVDVVVLNDAPPMLGRRIVTEGRCVLRAAAEVDHAFVRDVQLRAADLIPFLRRTGRLKLDALRR